MAAVSLVFGVAFAIGGTPLIVGANRRRRDDQRRGV
jgi:hypothetical protein